MKPPPTDLAILSEIYDRYYDEFASFSKDDPSRSAKIHVPIDIKIIAADLGVDCDIVFGRLYYHLNRKFGYRQENESRVDLFSLQVGGDRHCVNFPLVASILADLKHESRKHWTGIGIAVGSIIIAVGSLIVAIIALGS